MTNDEWLKSLEPAELKAWFDAEHVEPNDDLSPEKGASGTDGASNVTNAAQDNRYKLEEAMHNVIRDALLNLQTAIMHCVEQGMDVLSFDEGEFVDYECDEYVGEYLSRAMRLLERQAAITRRETLHDNPTCSGRSTCAANRPISESADRETPETSEIGASKDEIRDFDVWSVAYEIYCAGGYVDNGNEPNPPTDGIRELLDRQADITRRELQDEMDRLTRENIALARDLGECMAERDGYREKLGRAVDSAWEIVQLMDEGLA